MKDNKNSINDSKGEISLVAPKKSYETWWPPKLPKKLGDPHFNWAYDGYTRAPVKLEDFEI